METHEIRREYLNPSIIPDTAPGFARRFEVATFRVEEIAPGLFGSLFNGRPADAVIMSRQRTTTPTERREMERKGERPRLLAGPKYYRVIAYNGTPITTGEYTDILDTLRDAIQQREQPEPVEE